MPGLKMIFNRILRSSSCAFLLTLASISLAAEPRFDPDAIELWKAAAFQPWYCNRTLVNPQQAAIFVPAVDQLTQGPNGSAITRLARTIATRYSFLAKIQSKKDTNRQLENSLPQAWKASMTGVVLRGLIGSEPSLNDPRYGDIRGGLIDSIDAMRLNAADLNEAQALLNLLDTAVAAQVESICRKGPARVDLPTSSRIYVEETMDNIGVRDSGPNGLKRYMPGTLARIAHGGDRPLNHVLIVTRTKMKPLSEADVSARDKAGIFNRTFDNGEGRAEDADKLFASQNLLKTTPVACVVYVPRLDPGDVLVVPMFSQGSYYDVLEAKVSIHSEQGSIVDRVLISAGPHNDRSVPVKERPDRPKVPSGAPKGPPFRSVTRRGRMELKLKTTGANDDSSTFENCVPAGDSYVPIGRREQIDPARIHFAIASNDTHFVVEGPPRSTGHGLVLIPAERVASVSSIDERTDSEKAFDEAAAAQIARNNARARGELPGPPVRPTMRGMFGGNLFRGGQAGPPRGNAGAMTPNVRDARGPKPDPAPTPPAGPPYAEFQNVVTLMLPATSGNAGTMAFEGCVNSGQSYISTGRKITVTIEPGKPLRLVAEGPDHFVARVRNDRTKSFTLVLIPKSIGGNVKKTE